VYCNDRANTKNPRFPAKTGMVVAIDPSPKQDTLSSSRV